MRMLRLQSIPTRQIGPSTYRIQILNRWFCPENNNLCENDLLLIAIGSLILSPYYKFLQIELEQRDIFLSVECIRAQVRGAQPPVIGGV
jgi:hypothetical protein